MLNAYPIESKNKITLLTRNEPLGLMCNTCKKKPATLLCSIEQWTDVEYQFCDTCAKKHEKICDDFEEYAKMPVVNSPRMGKCAYEGGSIDNERDGN